MKDLDCFPDASQDDLEPLRIGKVAVPQQRLQRSQGVGVPLQGMARACKAYCHGEHEHGDEAQGHRGEGAEGNKDRGCDARVVRGGRNKARGSRQWRTRDHSKARRPRPPCSGLCPLGATRGTQPWDFSCVSTHARRATHAP